MDGSPNGVKYFYFVTINWLVTPTYIAYLGVFWWRWWRAPDLKILGYMVYFFPEFRLCKVSKEPFFF